VSRGLFNQHNPTHMHWSSRNPTNEAEWWRSAMEFCSETLAMEWPKVNAWVCDLERRRVIAKALSNHPKKFKYWYNTKYLQRLQLLKLAPITVGNWTYQRIVRKVSAHETHECWLQNTQSQKRHRHVVSATSLASRIVWGSSTVGTVIPNK
jgi:hypothetical protein